MLVLFAFSPFVSQLRAQEYLYEFGGRVGFSQYVGDVGRQAPLMLPSYTFSAEFRYNLDFRFAFSANLGCYALRGKLDYAENVFPEGRPVHLENRLYYLGLMGEYNFLPLSDKFPYLGTKRLSPFFGLGVGLGVAPSYRKATIAPAWQIGGGVKYRINAQWGLSLQWIYHGVFSDALDTPTGETSWLDNPYHIGQSVLRNGDGVCELTFSLTYSFSLRSKQDCREVRLPRRKLPNLNLN